MMRQASRRTAIFWLLTGLAIYLVAMLLLFALHATNDVAAAAGAWAGAIAVLITAYLAYTQLADLRRAAAFDSFMRAIEIWESREFSQALTQLTHAVDELRPFPVSFEALAAKSSDRYQREKLEDAIRFLIAALERTGVLFRYGHLDEDLFMQVESLVVVQLMDNIGGIAASERQDSRLSTVNENAFYLYDRSCEYLTDIEHQDYHIGWAIRQRYCKLRQPALR